MRHALAAAAVLAAAGAAHAQDAQDRPDLTGVWMLASPHMTQLGQYPDLPLTEEGRAAWEAYRALVDPGGETPGMYCASHGMPEVMMGGGNYPIEVIQKPGQVTIISELMSQIRRVFIGEDRIAPAETIFPSRQGYSTGRWEGDVLVVETAHLKALPDSRYPHSEAATITERFSLEEDADGTPRLIADTVVRDPLWLTEPLEYRLEWTPYEIGWVMPYECIEEVWYDRLDALAEDAGQPSVTRP